MVFRTSRDLPRIGIAAMQAEGFVNFSLPRPFRSRAQRPCGHTLRTAQEHEVRAA